MANKYAYEKETELESELLHNRFDTKEELTIAVSNVFNGHKVKLEETTNEDNVNLDYEFLWGLETKDNYYYITIYYLKMRNGGYYITEVSVDNE